MVFKTASLGKVEYSGLIYLAGVINRGRDSVGESLKRDTWDGRSGEYRVGLVSISHVQLGNYYQ